MVLCGLIIIAVVLMALLVLGVAQCQPRGRTGEAPGYRGGDIVSTFSCRNVEVTDRLAPGPARR
jgi:hypothetical protein